jgi:hypothetical protein
MRTPTRTGCSRAAPRASTRATRVEAREQNLVACTARRARRPPPAPGLLAPRRSARAFPARACRARARVAALGFAALCLGLGVLARPVRAEPLLTPKAREQPFSIPPSPAKARPRLAAELHISFAGPLNNGSLCPHGVGCVFQSGGGVGASVERRWPTGLGAFGAYDIWFLGSDSVYELGVQQAVRGGVRYTMPTEIVLHPLFDFSIGAMGYGDTFRVATVGGLAEIFAGAEIELTAKFGLRLGLGMRVFSHSRFRTQRDQILRGNHAFLAETLTAQVGLTIM